jgi:hypothetical protein
LLALALALTSAAEMPSRRPDVLIGVPPTPTGGPQSATPVVAGALNPGGDATPTTTDGRPLPGSILSDSPELPLAVPVDDAYRAAIASLAGRSAFGRRTTR